MSAESKIHVIGVGSDGLAGLTARGRELIARADLVLASESTMGRVPEVTCERFLFGPDLLDAVKLLEANLGRRRMVVLASGDPLFYGVARFLCDRLGKDRFEVLPHVSSMQLAFARVKETWEDAYLTNLGTHPLDAVVDRIRTAETVGLFTTEAEDPPRVARQLLARGIDYFRVYVCENLGAPNERVTQGELAEIQDLEFGPLNVMILVRKAGRPDARADASRFRRFGNPDDVFAQSRPKSGLITQSEVRAIGLAELDVQPGCVVWDIGAGSGAVAIEAAQLAQPGMVFAIEQDVADFHLIEANAQTFGVKNVKAVLGSAPAVFDGLPAPDAIFVGGTGKETARLLESAYKALRPGGRLVVNVATLESLHATHTILKTLAQPVQVLLINLARGTEQLETLRFEAINPSFLLTARK